MRLDIEEQLLHVVDGVYAAAANDCGWTVALERVCDFVGAQCADLNFFDPATGSIGRMLQARLEPDGLQRYLAAYAGDVTMINPRIPHFVRMSEHDCWADSDIWTPRCRAAIPFFAEMVHPFFGVYDALNTFIRKSTDGRPWLALLLHFGKQNGPPQAEARQRLKLLLPHLKRAFEVEDKLQTALQQQSILAEALDHVEDAVALISGSGRVVRANPVAQRIFRAAKGLALAHDERLLIGNCTARDTFAAGLAQCAIPTLLLSAPSAAPVVQIAVPRPDAAPLVLTLQPLSRSRTTAEGAVAILFIADPGAKPPDRLAALRNVYRLSPMEARLVQALAEGESLREFAAARQISYETVRTYVRHVLEKTGARRQAELVGFFHGLR